VAPNVKKSVVRVPVGGIDSRFSPTKSWTKNTKGWEQKIIFGNFYQKQKGAQVL
jgi:hypothetical protein